jgi:hypothetical protein
MSEALLVIQWLTAVAAAGVNIADVLGRVSKLIAERQAAGQTLTQADLNAILDAGDALEAAARKQFEDTLADSNTPKP